MNGVGTILLVEDDRDLAHAMKRRLTAAGFTVRVALDAYQATREVRLCPPELVILDYHLPAGDGICVHKRIIDLIGDCPPVIYISGKSNETIERAASEMGAMAFFRKPVDFEVLTAAIRNGLAPRTCTAGL